MSVEIQADKASAKYALEDLESILRAVQVPNDPKMPERVRSLVAGVRGFIEASVLVLPDRRSGASSKVSKARAKR